MPSLGVLLLYMLIPAAAVFVGAGAGLAREPSATVRSAVHHLAAGALFAAAAAELVVELVADRRLAALIIGFLVGAALMLLIRFLAQKIERRAVAGPGKLAGLLGTIGTDVFVDGIVVGIGFAIGQSSGLVFVVAFALEMTFLGLTTALELRASGARGAAVAAGPSCLAALLIAGSIVGHLLGHLSGFGFDLILAFALAVLIYLVTEELLVEAHDRPGEEAPLMAGFFFLAFLAILVLDIALG